MAYMERHQIDWTDPRVRMLDLQYHDMRPERSLFARVGAERLFTDDEVETGHDRAAGDHQGLLPGQVPPEVAR